MCRTTTTAMASSRLNPRAEPYKPKIVESTISTKPSLKFGEPKNVVPMPHEMFLPPSPPKSTPAPPLFPAQHPVNCCYQCHHPQIYYTCQLLHYPKASPAGCYYHPLSPLLPPQDRVEGYDGVGGGGRVVVKNRFGGAVGGKKVFPPKGYGKRRSSVEVAPRLRTNGRRVWKPKKSASPPPSPPAKVSGSGKTTVMIRNIPNQIRRDKFMDFLDKYCLEHQMEYDFLYLPMDFCRRNNLGYAFVNFTTPSAVEKIRELLNNFKWGSTENKWGGGFESKKICEITWARIQGKEQLMRHFRNSLFECHTYEYLPVVLSPPRNGSTCLTAPVIVGKWTGRKVIPVA